mgnify:CR=1 FL=1
MIREIQHHGLLIHACSVPHSTVAAPHCGGRTTELTRNPGALADALEKIEAQWRQARASEEILLKDLSGFHAIVAKARELKVRVTHLVNTHGHWDHIQAVTAVRDAGIEVYTTLNVQHLESLNDVVAQITGVTVRETLPAVLRGEVGADLSASARAELETLAHDAQTHHVGHDFSFQRDSCRLEDRQAAHPERAAREHGDSALVEDEQAGAKDNRPQQIEALLLASGQGHPALAHHRVVALGETGDELVGLGLAGGLLPGAGDHSLNLYVCQGRLLRQLPLRKW